MLENEKHISKFEKAFGNFIKELHKYVSIENGEWTIKGFIDVYKNIYTISSDTKIVSKILEIHLLPKLLNFAGQNGYQIVLAEHQNWYPDLTFIDKENSNVKFALDIKTTYRRKDNSVSFTLGSHGSYFKERDKSKNIQFPYNQYSGHYCLGIIYTRNDLERDLFNEKMSNIKNLKSLTSVIKDFDFFIAPKWKIASDSQGSGNTANIGSIKDIDDLKAGNGVFSQIGEKWFDEYWMNYGKATMIKNGKSIKINNIWEFLEFKGRLDLTEKIVAKGAKRRKKK